MLLKLWHALMALLFLFSVVVQLNDPDPIPWIVLYGAAFVLALAGVVGRPSGPGSIGLALVAGIWAMSLSPSLGAFAARDLSATHFQMKAGDVIEEEARECGGLLLVSFGALVLIMDANARRRRSVRGGNP